MARIYKKKTEIDSSKTRDFFEQRGNDVNLNHPLTSVLYQDKNPSLAEERDKYEKSAAKPLLRLSKDDDVLDVGCGIGRWSEVAKEVRSYHGVDFSESLISVAKSNKLAPNISFQSLAAEDIDPSCFSPQQTFSKVIIAGLLIYLNDTSVKKALMGINSCCRKNALIYLREPIAIDERLTLKEFWSEELMSDYSAIYRTRSELDEIFQETLLEEGFEISCEQPLYPEHLNNRVETQQYVFIFER